MPPAAIRGWDRSRWNELLLMKLSVRGGGERGGSGGSRRVTAEAMERMTGGWMGTRLKSQG